MRRQQDEERRKEQGKDVRMETRLVAGKKANEERVWSEMCVKENGILQQEGGDRTRNRVVYE